MLVSLRSSLIAAICTATLLFAPAYTLAGETSGSAGPSETSQSAPAPSGDAGGAKAGCPYSTSGGCCQECQKAAEQGEAPGRHQAADCPCKRARQAEQGS